MDTFIPVTQTKTLNNFKLHTGTVVSIIKPLPTSELILSLSIDKRVLLWDPVLGILDKAICEEAAPTKLILFPKNQKVLIPQWNNSFSLLDINSLQKESLSIDNYTGHTSWVLYAVELNKDKTFATCSRDKTIRIWNCSNNTCDSVLVGHTDIVNYILPIENCNILSCGSDGTIKQWDLSTNECIDSFKDGELPVFQIERIDNEHIISRSETNILNI